MDFASLLDKSIPGNSNNIAVKTCVTAPQGKIIPSLYIYTKRLYFLPDPIYLKFQDKNILLPIKISILQINPEQF